MCIAPLTHPLPLAGERWKMRDGAAYCCVVVLCDGSKLRSGWSCRIRK